MLSATSHIGLEFFTKFLNMLKLQNRLILLYQSLPLQNEPKVFKILMIKEINGYVNHLAESIIEVGQCLDCLNRRPVSYYNLDISF